MNIAVNLQLEYIFVVAIFYSQFDLFLQHCLICHPSISTVLEDSKIDRVLTLTQQWNLLFCPWATTLPQLATSHPQEARYHPLGNISSTIGYSHLATSRTLFPSLWVVLALNEMEYCIIRWKFNLDLTNCPGLHSSLKKAFRNGNAQKHLSV